jgi:uncharacterized protein (DUF1330 family)
MLLSGHKMTKIAAADTVSLFPNWTRNANAGRMSTLRRDWLKHYRWIYGELKMSVYILADVKVTDDSWVPGYAAAVHDIVHKHGGKYLARSGNVKTLEGSPLETTLIALLEFPTAEAATAFASDPEYAPFAASRQAGSESRFQLIDDTDLAGTIPYLPKG